jgi:hypothetical protein
MKNLKWIVGLFILSSFALQSCLDDENTQQVTYHYKGIDSIKIGEIRNAREVTEITTYFTRINACENFFDYEYRSLGNERTVTMVTYRVQESCSDGAIADSTVLRFRPDIPGTYTFRFWTGNDENQNPIFITQEIQIP